MPQVTVYVRKGDLDKWAGISMKSEWLSQHLNVDNNILEVSKALSEAKVPTEDRYVQTPEGIKGPVSLPVEQFATLKSIKLCSHSAAPGLCKKFGCKHYN